MKRIGIYILLIVYVASLFGCQKDFDGLLIAEIENYRSDAKVYVDAEDYSCWHAGDEVWVNGHKGVITINDEQTMATITGVSTEGVNKFNAVYPYDYAVVGENQFNFPARQEFRKKQSPNGMRYQVLDAPMVAYANSSSSTLQFCNAAALMQVKFKNVESESIDIRKIELTATDNSIINGVVNYNWDNKKLNVESPTGGTNMVVLDFPMGYNLLGHGEDKFYMAVPDGMYQFNIKVYYVTTGAIQKNCKIYTSKITVNAPKIDRNMIYSISLSETTQEGELATVTEFGTGTLDDPYEITTYEQLNGHMLEEGGLNKHYVLIENIVLPSGFDGFAQDPGAPFSGTLNGNGKTITYGGVGSRGIFRYMGGDAIVENLTLDANIQGNEEAVGGIVNNGRGGCIRNCMVKGNVNNLAWGVGGIAGQINGMMSVENCINRAMVSNGNYDEHKDETGAGGICGIVYIENVQDRPAKIKKCINEGSVFALGEACGGIVGLLRPCEVIIDGCINKGDVSTGRNAGGILGNCHNWQELNFSIVNCVNHGRVEAAEGIGGLCGNVTNQTLGKIYNCYTDGEIIATDGSLPQFMGCLFGEVKKIKVENVYVGNRVLPNHAKWICGVMWENNVECTNVYRPDGVGEDGIGSGVGTYNIDTWVVTNGGTLLEVLNGAVLPNDAPIGVQKSQWFETNKLKLEIENIESSSQCDLNEGYSDDNNIWF